MSNHRALALPVLLAAALALSACGHRKQKNADGTPVAAPAKAERADKPAKAPKAEAAPSPEATAAADAKIDKAAAEGQVPDVRGTPAEGSKFAQLRVGMSMKDVIKRLGKPDDKLSYITGKGFYWSHGSDTYRHEYVYAGSGRLTFSAKGGFSTDATLFRIIHNAQEPAKRVGPPPADAKS